jgi:hypothetical protein
MDWHEVINSLARFYADTAAAVENNPPELCVGGEGSACPLGKVVRDELVRMIFRWPHWQLLMQNSANGYIQPPSAAVRTSRRVNTPTRSDDLLRPFEQCVKQLDQFTRLMAGEAIDALLARLAEQVKTQREALGVFCEDAALRDRLKELVGPDSADLVDVLSEAADPPRLGGKLKATCLGTGDALPGLTEGDGESDALPCLDPCIVFPLPIGLKFGWNEEVWKELSPDQRSDHTHQSWVPRIRDTLISSVEEALLGLVGEINYRAVCNLRKECNELTFLLQNEIVAGAPDFLPALESILKGESRTLRLPNVQTRAAA